jgi:hypothetical protein
MISRHLADLTGPLLQFGHECRHFLPRHRLMVLDLANLALARQQVFETPIWLDSHHHAGARPWRLSISIRFDRGAWRPSPAWHQIGSSTRITAGVSISARGRCPMTAEA